MAGVREVELPGSDAVESPTTERSSAGCVGVSPSTWQARSLLSSAGFADCSSGVLPSAFSCLEPLREQEQSAPKAACVTVSLLKNLKFALQGLLLFQREILNLVRFTYLLKLFIELHAYIIMCGCGHHR